jgi:hypothetical protein
MSFEAGVFPAGPEKEINIVLFSGISGGSSHMLPSNKSMDGKFPTKVKASILGELPNCRHHLIPPQNKQPRWPVFQKKIFPKFLVTSTK